jgi:hypothetical protein
MKKWLIGLMIFIFATHCKRGTHQTIELKNSSSESVYYLISKNIEPDENEISKIRPAAYESFTENKKDHGHAKSDEDSTMRMRIKQNLYRYRIERNASAIILSSESAEIYVNIISIQSIIKDRYNGEANVFIIKERDLERNSDKEIIAKKLCTHFVSLNEGNLTHDTLILEYK